MPLASRVAVPVCLALAMIAAPACGGGSSAPGSDGSLSAGDAAADSAADTATDAGVPADDPSSEAGVSADGPSSDAGVSADRPSSDGADALSCLADASVQDQCTMACAGGQVCWDYSKHDPTCSGTICTIPCCADSDCTAYAAQHGAAVQNNARCGTDHLCSFVGVLGSFGCQ